MTLEPGGTIGGYRVVRPLGRGGMGAVYEAEHLELGTRCALKVFSRDHGDVESLRQRFRTEGRVLARLRHPNLLRVYDLGEDEGRGALYFAMDLVVGADGAPRTLEDVRPGDADEATLARWYAQLRSALEYVHAAGVVHRDVKPGNILVGADGGVILGDFGISRFLDGKLRRELEVENTMETDAASAGKVMGTAMFIAPEVRRGEKATAAADAYALGVTFYRLLTGVWYEPGPVAEGLLSGFGREWRSALAKLLSESPADRLPIPPVEIPAGGARLNRLFVAAGAAAAFLAAAAGAGAFIAFGRGESAAQTEAKYSFDQFFPLHKEN